VTAAGLELETVRDVERLAAVEDAWWDLAARAAAATPFQTPAWLLPWWRHLGRGALAAVVVRGGGRLLGLAPLVVEGDEAPRLRWLGAGVSDYLTALVDGERAAEVAPALARGFGALLDEVGGAALENVPDGDPLFAALEHLPPRWAWRRSVDACCLVAPLPPDETRATRPRVCDKADAAARRLARRGRVTCSSAGAGDDGRERLLGALFELHARRWSERGEAGVLAAAGVRAHHREAARAFERRGVLRLEAVELDGEPIAVFYGFHLRDRLWMYLCGFSPAHARFSPGSIVVARARAAARAEGARAMDFLRGREGYKYRWGVLERCTWRVDIERAP
jgi:CelD/BcsL family acetyltransferase involved in cellulose biosynthesis